MDPPLASGLLQHCNEQLNEHSTIHLSAALLHYPLPTTFWNPSIRLQATCPCLAITPPGSSNPLGLDCPVTSRVSLVHLGDGIEVPKRIDGRHLGKTFHSTTMSNIFRQAPSCATAKLWRGMVRNAMVTSPTLIILSSGAFAYLAYLGKSGCRKLALSSANPLVYYNEFSSGSSSKTAIHQRVHYPTQLHPIHVCIYVARI